MTTARQFRTLLTWSWVTLVLGVIIDLATEQTLPESLQEYLQAEYARSWTALEWIAVLIGLPLALAVIAAYVGLYRLRLWGRTLWLWTGVLGVIVTPLFGPTVCSVWAELLYYVTTVLYGFILAVAYLAPPARMVGNEPVAAPQPPPTAPVGKAAERHEP